MFKKHYTKATESAKNFYNSEDTQKFINSSKDFVTTSMEKPVVKHIVYAGAAGAFIGAALPVLSVGLCATAGATVGAYKYVTK